MTKIFSLAIFCGIIFCSCNNSTPPVSTVDTSTNKMGNGKSSMTIDNVKDPIAHAVKDSIYNGTHIEKYDNGVIYMRGEVEGGLRAGQWLSFYKSGKPWSQGTYKAGLRQGYGISWYENGQKSSEGNYKDDLPVGKWKYWDETGNLVQKDFGGQ